MFSINDNAKGFLRFVRTPIIVLVIFTLLMSSTVLAFTAGRNERPLTVYNKGEKKVFSTVLTEAEKMLSTYGIEVAENDGYELYENENGYYLSVGSPFTLTATKDGETKAGEFYCSSLEIALERLDFLPTVSYSVDLPLNTILTEDTAVNVAYNYTVYETACEEIPFETVYTDSDELFEGEEKVVTEGANGLCQKDYKVGYSDQNEVSREEVSAITLSEPVNAEILKGTKQKQSTASAVTESASVASSETVAASAAVKTSDSGITSSAEVNGRLVSPLSVGSPIEVDENGRPLNYSKCITAVATAYSPEDGNITATGEPAQLGYIAVNPRQIPYGTMMYIRASDGSYIYGVAKAADTGGFISNSTVKVDLFFWDGSSAVSFGRRNVEIYFI